jgi:hypothetical protein
VVTADARRRERPETEERAAQCGRHRRMEVENARTSRHQRLRPHRTRDVPRRAPAGRRDRVGRDQRRDGRALRRPAAGHRLRVRPVPGDGRGARRRDPRRWPGDPGVRRARPRCAPVARRRGRGRDRVERPLPRPCRRRPPPRGGSAQGHHLGAGQGAGRHRGAGRQLRRRLRPRAPPRDLQRLVHDELPRPDGEGAGRGLRDPPWRDDDRARLHGRPAAARRAAQGPAPGAGRRPQPGAHDDRCRRSGSSYPSWPG